MFYIKKVIDLTGCIEYELKGEPRFIRKGPGKTGCAKYDAISEFIQCCPEEM